MPKKKRDHAKEYKATGKKRQSTPKEIKNRAGRNAGRAIMVKAGAVKKGDNQDVDHKDRNPRNNSKSNLRVASQKKNRGWSRKA
tara:strand:- start:383 stop:634 length:252 start_codon:yes stop_codon:yes gene_type:complete